MALKRYVGPYPEVRITVAGNDLGTVENGSAIVVPDDIAETVAWSEHWEDVTKDPAEKKAAKAEEKSREKALGADPAKTNNEGNDA